MKPLYTQEQFNQSKSLDFLPCECYVCGKPFEVTKHQIQRVLNQNQTRVGKYCSRECVGVSLTFKTLVKCTNCGIEFKKLRKDIKRTKSGNHFCSRSCSTTFNNKNKTTGNRRSKLEFWLEAQLTHLFPNLTIDYNKKSGIQSELDIYIPSLNIAFELNGIFHYEPIYGVDKLTKTQVNDNNKFQLCNEAKIDLCVIDTSGQNYFKPDTSQKYLDIITNIIKERLATV